MNSPTERSEYCSLPKIMYFRPKLVNTYPRQPLPLAEASILSSVSQQSLPLLIPFLLLPLNPSPFAYHAQEKRTEIEARGRSYTNRLLGVTQDRKAQHRHTPIPKARHLLKKAEVYLRMYYTTISKHLTCRQNRHPLAVWCTICLRHEAR